MKTKRLIFSILICLLAGAIGSIFTANTIPTWYAGLVKPSFNPPNWIFMPVWTTLYILMGIALYYAWKARKIFYVQLGLNMLWSILFFGLRNPLFALIDIILLWFAIFLTMLNFYKISKKAFYLMVPYLLWVSFAAALNLFIVTLN